MGRHVKGGIARFEVGRDDLAAIRRADFIEIALLDGDGVAIGHGQVGGRGGEGGKDGNPVFGCAIEVDLVGADAEATDGHEAFAAVESLAIDLGA